MSQPSLAYNKLKFAQQMFQRAPHDLEGEPLDAVCRRAEDECALQEKILASKEGRRAVVAEKKIQEAIAGIARRYESPQAFMADLMTNGLDVPAMTSALEVDFTVEAALALVVNGVEPPSEVEVDAVWQGAHREAKEQRVMRHILITINDQFPENSREAALARISMIRAQAQVSTADFGALAQRYSECPSALQGGRLGPVARGGLFADQEDTLCAMKEGEVSEVVETTLGFHVLLCEKVVAAEAGDKKQDLAKIRLGLLRKARRKAVQTWLANL